MSPTRRNTLALLGGGVIVAATLGTGYTLTRTPRTAYLPWSRNGQYTEPRMRALSYAILAPNPHNRQPWLVDLRTPDQAVLYADTTRLLPHTDPFNRQIVIGLGCFLELLRLAALQDGLSVRFDLFPQGVHPAALDTRPVAVCRFVQDQTAIPDPLFAQALRRRTLKEPFDIDRPVTDTALHMLRAAVRHGTAVDTTNAPADIADYRALSREALRIEMTTPRTHKESVDLFRIGRREVDANPDGIDFTGPMFEGLAASGLFSRRAALDTESTAFRQGLASVSANTDTAMGYVWLVTAGNTRREQIAAGRDWLRINLAATDLGLGIHPLSQALQEYPEMAALHQGIHDRLAPGGGTVQMWARLGYGPRVGPSPRWSLESRLRCG